jgi:hypothetical protein
MGMSSGGVRVVHQNHEDEKNLPEFFEAGLLSRRTLMRSSPVSSLMRFDNPKSVKKNVLSFLQITTARTAVTGLTE